MSNKAYSHVVPDHIPGWVAGVVSLPDRDYFLREGAGWFEYNRVAIRIRNNEWAGCLEVSAYLTDHEDDDPIFKQFVYYD